jgi:mRNA interferase YafO
MIRVFKSSVIQNQLTKNELVQLTDDFKQYKATNILPKNFGRDVPYDHPNTLPTLKTEQVQHIHLGSEDKPLPFNRIQFHQTSDVHLVYCPSFNNDDIFLLMAILSPDAHQQAKNREIMYKLGVMAEGFRNKY